MRPTLSLLKAAKPKGAVGFPRSRPGPTAAAFALVKQVLSERPLHFREILGRGVEALPDLQAEGEAGAGAGAEAESSTAAQKKAAAKKINTNPFKVRAVAKGVAKDRTALEEIPVPEGHPFVSGNYLKNRIIPTLASLGLIQRRWVAPYPDTELARHAGEKLHVMWELTPDAAKATKASASWDQVTAPDFSYTQLREIGASVRAQQAEIAEAQREAKFASGELERSARDIMAWKDRPKGFTTYLERTHLNTRRAKGRDAKEAQRAQLLAEQRAALEAARAVVDA